METGNMKKNFEVKNEEVEKTLKDIGKVIGKQMPKGMGFALFMFDFGEDGAMFYLSSAKRKDLKKALLEFIEKTDE